MANFTLASIKIIGIASAIPENKVLLEQFENQFEANKVDYFKSRTGVSELNKSLDLQNTSDLGFVAANAILQQKNIEREEVGVIIFVSKTPDYRSPATAIVLHNRLQLHKDCLGFDVNMGGAGFIYGMEIVTSLLDSSNKKYGILVVGDTMSKQLAHQDELNMFYSDGASAILFEKNTEAKPIYLQTKSFSDGYKSMIVPGGFRNTSKNTPIQLHDSNPNSNTVIQIDEKAINDFITSEIPSLIESFLKNKNKLISEYDLIIFPQLEEPFQSELAKNLGIPKEKISTNFEKYGDTCGNGIPLLISDNFGKSEKKQSNILSIAFGEGFTCGIADFFIDSSDVLEVLYTNDYFKDGYVTHEMPS